MSQRKIENKRGKKRGESKDLVMKAWSEVISNQPLILVLMCPPSIVSDWFISDCRLAWS